MVDPALCAKPTATDGFSLWYELKARGGLDLRRRTDGSCFHYTVVLAAAASTGPRPQRYSLFAQMRGGIGSRDPTEETTAPRVVAGDLVNSPAASRAVAA